MQESDLEESQAPKIKLLVLYSNQGWARQTMGEFGFLASLNNYHCSYVMIIGRGAWQVREATAPFAAELQCHTVLIKADFKPELLAGHRSKRLLQGLPKEEPHVGSGYVSLSLALSSPSSDIQDVSFPHRWSKSQVPSRLSLRPEALRTRKATQGAFPGSLISKCVSMVEFEYATT